MDMYKARQGRRQPENTLKQKKSTQERIYKELLGKEKKHFLLFPLHFIGTSFPRLSFPRKFIYKALLGKDKNISFYSHCVSSGCLFHVSHFPRNSFYISELCISWNPLTHCFVHVLFVIYRKTVASVYFIVYIFCIQNGELINF